jgi:hypothetical protein
VAGHRVVLGLRRARIAYIAFKFVDTGALGVELGTHCLYLLDQLGHRLGLCRKGSQGGAEGQHAHTG